ncbi:AbrB/MazE/SpoVT family DNA-binding domain-containing protein [Ruminiclostridium josui]|uniref:AbrB/MazE/SpoVT family DNA-binding domain-containing protein n=1 Tax=Ruminiclostridium josui TaxID=1499 RepID=UPI000464D110|nr:AbrB/MazE/SpoVT family DNA-binding domain-containing protein [Ruminiclostridium josui]
MKAVGVVRKLDSLGRYVLPKELRSRLNIDIGDSLEVFVDGNSILLRKYEPYCIFCNEVKDVNYYKGKNVCSRCMGELKG